MKVAAGPWQIKGRGCAVILVLEAGERAEVGDRLRRADGATWVLSGIECGAVDGAVLLRGGAPPSVGDELDHAHIVERMAWVRFVKVGRISARWIGLGQRPPQAVDDEFVAVCQALRDLGVDVDSLLEEE